MVFSFTSICGGKNASAGGRFNREPPPSYIHFLMRRKPTCKPWSFLHGGAFIRTPRVSAGQPLGKCHDPFLPYSTCGFSRSDSRRVVLRQRSVSLRPP